MIGRVLCICLDKLFLSISLLTFISGPENICLIFILFVFHSLYTQEHFYSRLKLESIECVHNHGYVGPYRVVKCQHWCL